MTRAISLPIGYFFFVLIAAGDDVERGFRAFREGRFAEALAAFAEAEKKAGDDASPVLLHNEAIAALRAGDPAAAEAAAEKMSSRGAAEFGPIRDFVRGNAAFARSEKAALLAKELEAEPFAFDSAIALAETARASWQRAAASRADWPEARRNTERALLAIADLKKKKAEAEAKKKKTEKELSPPPPEKKRPDESEAAPEEAVVEPALSLLGREEVERLFERLNAKEREKLALRRSERRARATGAERDW